MYGRRAAKGCGTGMWFFSHALRNALIPTVTVLGLAIGSAVVGAVLTETIFAWPGIGRYAYGAALALDFPAIIGVSLLTGVIFVAANLVVDLSYIVLDPRRIASNSAKSLSVKLFWRHSFGEVHPKESKTQMPSRFYG